MALLPTLAAVLPEAEVHSRDLLAAHHALWVRCHTEDVPLELLDVVAVVTDDTSKGCLSELSQLRWREDSWILIPKSAGGCNHSMCKEGRWQKSSSTSAWQHPKELLFLLSGGCEHKVQICEPRNPCELQSATTHTHSPVQGNPKALAQGANCESQGSSYRYSLKF